MKITDTQLQIVCYLANGKRIGEIAKLMHISESSVKQSIRYARIRLRANTPPHLISIAIAQGLLIWEDGERAIPVEDGDPASVPPLTEPPSINRV